MALLKARPRRKLSAAGAAVEDAGLDFTIALEKEFVVRNGLFHELLEQEHFGAVDDGVDAVLKRFHRGEGLKGVADEQDSGVPTLVHGHGLECLDRKSTRLNSSHLG